jgi:hypothetical protein
VQSRIQSLQEGRWRASDIGQTEEKPRSLPGRGFLLPTDRCGRPSGFAVSDSPQLRNFVGIQPLQKKKAPQTGRKFAPGASRKSFPTVCSGSPTSWTAIALRLSLWVILGLAALTSAVFVSPTSFHSASNKKGPRKGRNRLASGEFNKVASRSAH